MHLNHCEWNTHFRNVIGTISFYNDFSLLQPLFVFSHLKPFSYSQISDNYDIPEGEKL